MESWHILHHCLHLSKAPKPLASKLLSCSVCGHDMKHDATVFPLHPFRCTDKWRTYHGCLHVSNGLRCLHLSKALKPLACKLPICSVCGHNMKHNATVFPLHVFRCADRPHTLHCCLHVSNV